MNDSLKLLGDPYLCIVRNLVTGFTQRNPEWCAPEILREIGKEESIWCCRSLKNMTRKGRERVKWVFSQKMHG